MSYKILPFRFDRFNDNEVIISNEVGEFIFISNHEFENFVNYKLDLQSEIFLDLKSKQILTDTEIAPMVMILATKYRTKKNVLSNFTCLHMVIDLIWINLQQKK